MRRLGIWLLLAPIYLAFFGGGGGGGGFRGGRRLGRQQHGDTPMNNQAQNRQSRAIARELGITDPAQRRELHDLISGQGWGFQRALQEARIFFGLD